jgi:dTMP kinase
MGERWEIYGTADSINNMFIAFEGLAGTGKTTNSLKLAKYLEENYKVKTFYSSIYEGENKNIVDNFIQQSLIGNNDKAVMFLFQALHSKQYREVAEKIGDGYCVVADRWRESFVIYHKNSGLFDKAKNLVDVLDDFTFENLYPDICFYIDVNAITAFDRYSERENAVSGSLKREDLSFFISTKEKYDKIAHERKWIIIDGNQSEDVVFQEILNHLKLLWKQ